MVMEVADGDDWYDVVEVVNDGGVSSHVGVGDEVVSKRRMGFRIVMDLLVVIGVVVVVKSVESSTSISSFILLVLTRLS
ncbi:hypothetical protein Tco_0848922 [Tanacetum coccineum]